MSVMSRGIIMAYVGVRMPGKDLSERQGRTSWPTWFFFFGKMRVFWSIWKQSRAAQRWSGERNNARQSRYEMIAGGEVREVKICDENPPTGGGRSRVFTGRKTIKRRERGGNMEARKQRAAK